MTHRLPSHQPMSTPIATDACRQQPTTAPQLPTPGSQHGGIISLLFVIVILVSMSVLAWYILRQDRLITQKFEGKRWNIPAKVYSQPLELSQGMYLTSAQLENWLELLDYREAKNYRTLATFNKKLGKDKTDGKPTAEYYIHVRSFDFSTSDIEPEQVIKVNLKDNLIASLQSTHPNTTGVARIEPVLIGGIYPDNNEDRIVLSLKDMPKPLIDALIATEDRGFYQHHGISIRGIGRAIVSNVTGKARQGGSTITQQLVKNFYLNSDKTFKRKANEALMSILLEMHYGKGDILQTYMNEINLGQNGNHSVNGFGLASQFYFNRPLNELRLDQLALLVGLAKGPSQYNPFRDPKAALERRNTVLENMLVTGKIDQPTYEDAITQPLDVVQKPIIGKSRFPDYLDIVKRELNKTYRNEDLKNEGLRIFTSFNPNVQKSADAAVKDSLTKLRKTDPKQLSNLQAALVSADPRTGELLAVVGSGNEFTGFNRAVDAKRQVGSLLKPMIYLTAFEQGKYNLASSVSDNPVKLKLSNGETWMPANYGSSNGGGSHGNVPLMTALANSYNLAAVNVGIDVGIPNFITQLQKMGVTSQVPNYPATLLGAINLSPMDMLGLYQVLATGGYKRDIHTIRSIVDSQGRLIQGNNLQNKQVVPIVPAFLTNYAMQQVIKDGTAKPALILGEELNLAGKTGTTNDYRDAWFAGYSGNYVSVVWVGRDDNQPTGLSGGNGALPMWINYMQRLSLLPVNITQPDNIEWLWLENGQGSLSNENCANAIKVPVNTENLPQESSECAVRLYQAQQDARFASQRVTDANELYSSEQRRQLAIDAQNQSYDSNHSDSENSSGNGITIENHPTNNATTPTEPAASNNSGRPLNPESRSQSWLEKSTKEWF